MGFVDFTKLSFALSSLAQPFDQMGSISEYVFAILSQHKAYTSKRNTHIHKYLGGEIFWLHKFLCMYRIMMSFKDGRVYKS